MSRYALLQIGTGVVWWVGSADSPEAACSAADEATGGVLRTYTRAHDDGVYAVYEAPDGFQVRDGADEAEIERVLALPLVGRYRPTQAEETDADSLRAWLAIHGRSQTGLARELDVAPRTVRYWCAGEQPVPRVVWLALETLASRPAVRVD